jgi:fatty-acid desaturase
LTRAPYGNIDDCKCREIEPDQESAIVIVLGVILLLLGLLLSVPVLWAIGLVLVIVGAVLWVAGSAGHAIGGHRHYY